MTLTDELLNVDYWHTLYEIEEVNTGQYERGMQKDTYAQRLEALWSWKGLNRSVDFDDIERFLRERKADVHSCLSETPERAVEQLSEFLIEESVLKHPTVVTPAFMLHVGDSENSYSETFPIFDRRVWFAYSYLVKDRVGSESLPDSATTSPKRYGEFCEWFKRLGTTDPQAFERALFVFGGFLKSIPAETIEAKEEYIQSLEEAVTNHPNNPEFAIVNIRSN
jgi:hypothetical protein